MNYVVLLKDLAKKTLKTASKSGSKRQRNACSNYAPVERTTHRIRSVTDRKKNRNKSITSNAMQYRQDTVTRICCYT